MPTIRPNNRAAVSVGKLFPTPPYKYLLCRSPVCCGKTTLQGEQQTVALEIFPL